MAVFSNYVSPPNQLTGSEKTIIEQNGYTYSVSLSLIGELFTQLPVSGLNIYGIPTVLGNFVGQTQANNFQINSTPVSNTEAEGGFLVSLTSSNGAPSGNGPVSAYKIGGAIQVTANPGSGNIYAMNFVTTLNAGLGNFTGSGIEINTNNFNHDYPFAGSGGGVSYPLQILADSLYPVTAALAIGTSDPSHYAYNAGIYFSTFFGAKFASIYDVCNSQYSYHDAGTHYSAGIWMAAATPIGFFSSGTYSGAAFQDNGTAPYGAVFAGNYSTAGIIVNPSGGASVAISVPQNYKVCFAGLDVSLSFDGTKLIGTKSGVAIFSVNMTNGNAIFKGTVTQNGTP